MDINQFFFKYGVYLPATWLRGQNVFGTLRALRASQFASKAEIESLQIQRLNALLGHAKTAIPYYQEAFAKSLTNVSKLSDLEQFPTLDKSTVKNFEPQLRLATLPGFTVAKTTGGSTGQPVTIYKSRTAMAHELAATWRGYSWAGIDIGDRQARFWGVPFTTGARRDAKLTDWVCNRHRCSAFGFSGDTLARYARELEKFQPVYFYGYVSMLLAFANHFLDSKAPPRYPLKAIITTSEVLTPLARDRLQSAFGTRIYNEYGCGELGTVAHECEHGGLHLTEENLIVEILQGNRPCKAGEKGELVITELHNRTMPLIRYRTGDFAAFSDKPCPCGRTLRCIEELYGRAYDFIVDAQGRQFHGELLVYVFEEAKRIESGIGQFQVTQLAVDRFHVKIVPSAGFTESTQQMILRRMQSLLGTEINVRFDLVTEIPRERSGKMRVIVGMPDNAT